MTRVSKKHIMLLYPSRIQNANSRFLRAMAEPRDWDDPDRNNPDRNNPDRNNPDRND